MSSRRQQRPRWRRHPVALSLAVVLVAATLPWAVRLTQLAHGVRTAEQYWAQPRGQVGGLVYVALGDSAAQGIGASRPERGYVGLVADDLRTATGRPVLVVNLSRSGARIRDVLTRQLPELASLRLKADLITVDIGGNDIPPYESGRFERDATELAAALPLGTVLADIPYFMHGSWETHARQASAVLTRRASQRGLVVVPLHAALRAQGWQAMLTQFAPDWFHPNDRGYRVWARAFWTSVVGTGTVARAQPGPTPGPARH